MVKANLRVVISIAKNIPAGLQFLDLIQVGNVRLMKAVDKFEYWRGYTFATYAAARSPTRRAIRIPVHMMDAISKSCARTG